jgi:hypothetical protein
MSVQGNEMRRPWRVTAKPASDPPASSYLSVNEESFPTVLARMRAGKAESRNVSKSYSRHATI